jgi:hypothetical protein
MGVVVKFKAAKLAGFLAEHPSTLHANLQMLSAKCLIAAFTEGQRSMPTRLAAIASRRMTLGTFVKATHGHTLHFG